ncbi:hypothetical protein V866_005947 [Kwoniella sp. B9012]
MSFYKREFYDDESAQLPIELKKRLSLYQKEALDLTASHLINAKQENDLIQVTVQTNCISSDGIENLTYRGTRALGEMIATFNMVASDSVAGQKLTDDDNARLDADIRNIIQGKLTEKSERWKRIFENEGLIGMVQSSRDIFNICKAQYGQHDDDAQCGFDLKSKQGLLSSCWVIKQTFDELISDMQVRRSMSQYLDYLDVLQRKKTALLQNLYQKSVMKSFRDTLNSLYPQLSQEDQAQVLDITNEFYEGAVNFIEDLRHEHIMGICGHRDLPEELITEYQKGDGIRPDGDVHDSVLSILGMTKLSDLPSLAEDLRQGLFKDLSVTSGLTNDVNSQLRKKRRKGGGRSVKPQRATDDAKRTLDEFSVEELERKAERINYTLNIQENPSKCISEMTDLVDTQNKISKASTEVCESQINSTSSFKPYLEPARLDTFEDVGKAVEGLAHLAENTPKLQKDQRAVANMYSKISDTVDSCRLGLLDNAQRLISEAEAGARCIEQSNLTEMDSDDPLVNLAKGAFSAKSKLDLNHLYRLKSMISGDVLDSQGKPLTHMSRKTRFGLQRTYDSYKKAMSKTPFKDVQSLSDLEFTLEEMGDWQEDDEGNLTSALNQLTISEDEEEGEVLILYVEYDKLIEV